MATSTAVSHDIQQLLDKIKDIRIAMFTTADQQGNLHSRPMFTQEPEADGTLWFFSEKESAKIHEVRQESHVNLGYADPGSNLYVSVSGRCRVVEDRQKIKELWSEPLRGWFPDGPEDSNIALLRVDIDSGEYWSAPSNVLVRAYAYAKAVFTGQPAHENSGPSEHARVNVK